MAMTRQDWPKLLSLAVHELRTPMSVVNGYVRMLSGEKAGPLTDMQRKLLGETEKSCARLVSLLTELSDLSKFDSGAVALQRHDLDVVSLVDDVAREIAGGAGRALRLQTPGAAEPTVGAGVGVGIGIGIVHGDRARLRAAFAAILHVITREVFDDADLIVERRLARDATGPSVVIAVAGDEGALRLLGRGRRRSALDEGRGGAGLSLPLARLIIEAHGGVAWSPPGKRAPAIAVRLPLKHA